MALVARFDTPASLHDLPAGSPFYDNWHNYIAGHLDASTPGTGGGEFYDASQTDVNIAGEHALVWMAFPRRVLMPRRDDRTAAFIEADRTPGGDVGNRFVQDEYCEWRVARNAAGKITKVTFTTESPEYWEHLWAVDRGRVVDLYHELVSPAVVEADLHLGGVYQRRNRWNNADGITHLMQSINTLTAALGLAEGSATTPQTQITGVPPPPLPLPPASDNYEMPAVANTSVDPRVVYDVGALVRKPLSVTLREPIGLYITGYDDTGWTKPDGSPVGDYWTIVRGNPGQILRLEYQVPPGAGFVVGDIRIGGRHIEWGGQIAEHVTVTIAGVAGVRA
jgi:hypothetical protein